MTKRLRWYIYSEVGSTPSVRLFFTKNIFYKDMGRTKIRLDIPNLTPGMKFRHDGGVYHVVDVVDDNGKIIIVTKYFGIHT